MTKIYLKASAYELNQGKGLQKLSIKCKFLYESTEVNVNVSAE